MDGSGGCGGADIRLAHDLRVLASTGPASEYQVADGDDHGDAGDRDACRRAGAEAARRGRMGRCGGCGAHGRGRSVGLGRGRAYARQRADGCRDWAEKNGRRISRILCTTVSYGAMSVVVQGAVG